MATPETDNVDGLLSRRQFLAQTSRAAAGTVLAPTLLSLAGCQRRAGTVDPAKVVLTASRFEGAPDGRSREILGYNGQFPGPVIRAREGETLRIRVVNNLEVPTTVHWHGMHQPGTWRMDGVADVTQTPIPAGSDFLYEFKATPAGTHWYHSHTGVQYGEGLYGPLIIEERTPIATYDREEILMIGDWFLQPGEELLANLLKKPAMKMPGHMDMKGKPDVGDVPFQSALFDGKGRAPGNTSNPLKVVEVSRGETLRLRLINSSSTYAFRFQIDGHPLTVIASDGMPMKPVTVDNLVLSIGERYDVLLKAEGEGTCWVRATTLDGNEGRAVLRYKGAAAAEPSPSPVKWGPRALTPEEMRSPQPVKLAANPREIPLVLGGSMMPYRWSINDQYFPKADPLTIQKDEVIRFTLRNPTGMEHPFHLHGHSFHVLGKAGALNLSDPVLKDTVSVPPKSELVIQWLADNPGRWFFHCHIEWHLATGMARVLEIQPY